MRREKGFFLMQHTQITQHTINLMIWSFSSFRIIWKFFPNLHSNPFIISPQTTSFFPCKSSQFYTRKKFDNEKVKKVVLSTTGVDNSFNTLSISLFISSLYKSLENDKILNQSLILKSHELIYQKGLFYYVFEKKPD